MSQKRRRNLIRVRKVPSAVSKVDFGVIAIILAAWVAKPHLWLVGAQVSEDEGRGVDLVDELVLAHGGVLLLDLIVALAELLLHHQLVLVLGGHERDHVLAAACRADVADALLGVRLVRVVATDVLGDLAALHLAYS